VQIRGLFFIVLDISEKSFNKLALREYKNILGSVPMSKNGKNSYSFF